MEVAHMVVGKTKVSKLTALFSILLLATAGGAVSSSESASKFKGTSRVVPVNYGINKVQLTEQGLRGLLIRGRRDNGNAHGFDVLTIYALAPSKEEPDVNFLFVPVWGPDEKERLELTAGGGADCKLSDFRFVTGAGRDLQLITAEREFGTTYIDEGVVTFTYYQLKQNADVQPGHPLYYFENVKTSKAAKTYCDVDEALKQELGIEAS
jgi:hypothetical protein